MPFAVRQPWLGGWTDRRAGGLVVEQAIGEGTWEGEGRERGRGWERRADLRAEGRACG